MHGGNEAGEGGGLPGECFGSYFLDSGEQTGAEFEFLERIRFES